MGLQEILEMKSKNWNKIILEQTKQITKLWKAFFEENLPNHQVLHVENLLGILMIILVKKSVNEAYLFKVQETKLLRLGQLNLANKGAIAVQISINFQRVTFITCHLASGTKEQNYQKRLHQFERLHGLMNEFENSIVGFVFGDMNFRMLAS